MSAKLPSTEPVWVDPDDAPELTGKELDRPDAVWSIGGQRVAPEEGKTAFRAMLTRGGLAGGRTKVSTTVRFDAEVIDSFRATGKGWQTRMNDALRDWLKSHSPA